VPGSRCVDTLRQCWHLKKRGRHRRDLRTFPYADRISRIVHAPRGAGGPRKLHTSKFRNFESMRPTVQSFRCVFASRITARVSSDPMFFGARDETRPLFVFLCSAQAPHSVSAEFLARGGCRGVFCVRVLEGSQILRCFLKFLLAAAACNRNGIIVWPPLGLSRHFEFELRSPAVTSNKPLDNPPQELSLPRGTPKLIRLHLKPFSSPRHCETKRPNHAAKSRPPASPAVSRNHHRKAQ